MRSAKSVGRHEVTGRARQRLISLQSQAYSPRVSTLTTRPPSPERGSFATLPVDNATAYPDKLSGVVIAT